MKVEYTQRIRNAEVKLRRLALNLSQHDVARRAGVSKSYVGWMENFRRVPIESARKICDVLEIDVDVAYPAWLREIHDKAFPRQDNLKIIRSSRGMTQAELSEETGVSTEDISFAENGRRPLERDKAKKISAALGVPMTSFSSVREHVVKIPTEITIVRDVGETAFQKLVASAPDRALVDYRDPATMAELGEEASIIYEAYLTLPARPRHVLRLYVAGWSMQEIAGNVSLGKTGVFNILNDAIYKVAKVIPKTIADGGRLRLLELVGYAIHHKELKVDTTVKERPKGGYRKSHANLANLPIVTKYKRYASSR